MTRWSEWWFLGEEGSVRGKEPSENSDKRGASVRSSEGAIATERGRTMWRSHLRAGFFIDFQYFMKIL